MASSSARAGADDYEGPSYSPDDAGLKVFRLYGRWFAVWTDLEEDCPPEDRRIELVRIEADASSPFGVVLHEV